MFTADQTDIDLPCVEEKEIQIRSVVNHLNPSLQFKNVNGLEKFNDESDMFVGSFNQLFALNVFDRQDESKGEEKASIFKKKASHPLRMNSSHAFQSLRGSEA